MPEKASKIVLTIPPEYTEKVMEAINAVITPFYPGYDMCFSVTKTMGTWRSLKGSHPFNGKIGEVTHAEEDRIEFIVREDEIRPAIKAILSVHPYEEPAIDIIPCYGWKSFY